MKIAVTGKGGVGKTTVAALLIRELERRGRRVIAIDADPDANLASALGFPAAEAPAPIAEMSDLVEERTGAKPGQSGSFFTINPKVDDLPERFSLARSGVRLMVMGTVKKGGAGCVCPESALLKSLLAHVVLFRDDVVVMDMEAGIEHLGRGTARSMDMLVIVVEPGLRSVETAGKIMALAKDIGVPKTGVVGNKIRSQRDEEFVRERLGGAGLLGFIPYDEGLIEADIVGASAPELFRDRAAAILDRIG